MTPPNVAVGDRVALVSGSPAMTVSGITLDPAGKPLTIAVLWADHNGVIHSNAFNVAVLVAVPPPVVG